MFRLVVAGNAMLLSCALHPLDARAVPLDNGLSLASGGLFLLGLLNATCGLLRLKAIADHG